MNDRPFPGDEAETEELDLGSGEEEAIEEAMKEALEAVEGLRFEREKDDRLGSVEGDTEAGLREIVMAPQASFIHWRWEGIGDNETGDRYFCDMVVEFAERFGRLIRIEGRDYRFQMRRIKEVLDEFNPRSAYNTHELPNYSIAGFGGEARIEGPPDPDSYAQEYEAWREPVGGYIRDLEND